MSNLKILEAIINNDPKRIVESIKKALVSKSKDEIRKQIQKESLAYLNEESNIKRIEKHISTKRNSKLLLKFKNGRAFSIDLKTVKGLHDLYSSLKSSEKRNFIAKLDQDISSFMLLISDAKEKGLI
jgi:MFS superfamily sulfate permease-like transporter